MYLRADTLFSLNLLIGVALPEVFSIVGHSLARLFICETLRSRTRLSFALLFGIDKVLLLRSKS